MKKVCCLAAFLLLGLVTAALAANENTKLPPGVKMPPQPKEWVAPSVDMTPPSAPARFSAEWKKDKSLPTPLAGHSAVAIGQYIYVIGGVSGKEHLGMREVWSARGGQGNISSWRKVSALPVPLGFAATVVVGKRIYVAGGASREGMHRLYDSVFSAEAKPDGGLGSWREERKMPAALMYHAAATVDGYIYVLGGFNGQQYSVKTLITKVAPDGTLGEWKESKADYINPIGRTLLVAVGNDLVVVGGLFWDSQGEHITSLVMRGVRAADGDVTSWATEDGIKIASRSMNFSLAELAGTTDANFVYAAAGRDPAALGVATVQAAWINPQGILTRWQFGPELPDWDVKGSRQPAKLYQSTCVIAGNRLYVLGGFLSVREPTKNVWSIALKPYAEPDWVKAQREKAGKK